MSTILYVDTFGTDDPTRASLSFVAALGALEAGHQAQIVLLSEATYLMKGDIFEQVYGMGLPPLKDVLPKLIDHGVPIYV